MNNTLKIGAPYLTNSPKKGYMRLYSKLSIGSTEKYDVWYEVEEKFASYFTLERSDGLLVNLLLYAMEHSLDIECEAEVSEKLYYQLTEYLIPSISSKIEKYHRIKIDAKLSSEILSIANGGGASLSGGVDSFYTLLRHLNRKEEDYNISCLTFFNAGASGNFGGDDARELYLSRIDWIKKSCS